jgi:prophage maintenance system killer protein
MHYLTVQDVLWINLQVTKRTQTFNYARLEEATFYQYGYGQSSSVMSQTGRFLSGFIQKKPFAVGNEGTAFVACLAFLRINGMTVDLMDDSATSWIERASRDSTAATQALSDFAVPEENYREDAEPDVRAAIREVLDAYPKAISLLSRSGHAVAL